MKHAVMALAILAVCGCGNNPQGPAPWPDGAELWVSSNFADTALAWSPYGNVLLFAADMGTSACIYGFDGTGTPARCTFTNLNESTGPNGCWNAQNLRIIYSATVDSTGAGELRTIPGNGTAVTVVLSSDAEVSFPSWNPAGDSLVFAMRPLNSWSRRLFTMPLAGDSIQPSEVPLPAGDCVRPSYSPDGQWLLYQFRETANSPWELWTARPDGSQARAVASGGNSIHPCWGPSDGWFAFSTDRWGNPEIALGNIGSDTVIRLTDDPASDLYPAWNPTLSWIAFASDRLVGFDIYSIPEPSLPDVR